MTTDIQARSLALKALAAEGAGLPFVLIAAANASAQVKASANYVCTGANDDAVVQAAINALPNSPPTKDGAGHTITGGKIGAIWLSLGTFKFSSLVTIPPGSTVAIRGCGTSQWIPIVSALSTYDGGTVIYCTESQGQCIAFPKSTFGTPATGIYMQDLEIRVLNISSATASITLNLDGMITGLISNINVLCDLSAIATPNIGTGISLGAGGASSRKVMMGVNCYGFQDQCIVFSTTHLFAANISAGLASNNAFSSCFNITPQDDCQYIGLQCFSGKYGIIVSNNFALQCFLDSVHFEAITFPMLVNGTYPVELGTVDIDTGVSWTGDITNKVRVNRLQYKTSPGKYLENFGTVTLTAGATSVTWAHNLLVAPTQVQVTPQTSSLYSATSDATNVTIAVPVALGANAVFNVAARVGV